MDKAEAATGKQVQRRRVRMRSLGGSPRSRSLAAAAALAVAAAAGIVVWLVLRGGDSATRAPEHPVAASPQRLAALARALHHPIYWIGPRPTYAYELSRASGGRVYVRYLPHGVAIGSSRPVYLTVGTYPQRHAFANLRATAKAQGVRTVPVAGGGLAFQDKGRPTSVYLAWPASDLQVEVFDPSPSRALRLATSGDVTPVAASTRPASTAASPRELKAAAVSLGHPVFWAGARPGVTYELTRTKDGRVYVRYLPAGVAVGDARPDYLTVGTYPQKNAFATLEATAAKSNARTLKLPRGALGMVDAKRPTSVYVAYPGVALQIEVYDPEPARARRLVTSGRIVPVG